VRRDVPSGGERCKSYSTRGGGGGGGAGDGQESSDGGGRGRDQPYGKGECRGNAGQSGTEERERR